MNREYSRQTLDQSEAGGGDVSRTGGVHVRLAEFSAEEFHRGRSRLTESLWMVVGALFVSSFLPGSWHRVALLRLFGARVGRGIVMKPRVRVKFPWRLSIGDHSWIGENVWIDNLADVAIGSNCCISQGAYLCTGSHDWSSPEFKLVTKGIVVENCAWIAARAVVAPGVKIGEGSVLALGSTAQANTNVWAIYSGTPASFVKARIVE